MSVLMGSLLITGVIGLIALGIKTENTREINNLRRKVRSLERKNHSLTEMLDLLTEMLDQEMYRSQLQIAKIHELNEAKAVQKNIKKIVM